MNNSISKMPVLLVFYSIIIITGCSDDDSLKFPRDGFWSGKTNQNENIHFNVLNSSTRIEDFKITISCSVSWGTMNVTITYPPGFPINDNEFTWDDYDISIKGFFENATHCYGVFSYADDKGIKCCIFRFL